MLQRGVSRWGGGVTVWVLGGEGSHETVDPRRFLLCVACGALWVQPQDTPCGRPERPRRILGEHQSQLESEPPTGQTQQRQSIRLDHLRPEYQDHCPDVRWHLLSAREYIQRGDRVL